MVNSSHYIVAGVIFIIFLIFFILIRLYLKRTEASRSKIVKDRGDTAPIETSSPIDHPNRQATRVALKSIRTRFTVIRHLVIIILSIILLGVLAFPILGTIPGTMISAVIAGFSMVIGIAARPFLENLVAGIMITFSGVVKVSDTVIINDNYGVIEDITPTHIIIKLWDWRRYVLPNSKALTEDFVSLTLRDSYQWVKVEFWVTPDADLEEVEKEAIASAKRSDCFADHEPPNFWIIEMEKEGIHCWITAWADSPSDAWQLRHDIRSALATRFRKKGIIAHRFNLFCDHSSDTFHVPSSAHS